MVPLGAGTAHTGAADTDSATTGGGVDVVVVDDVPGRVVVT